MPTPPPDSRAAPATFYDGFHYCFGRALEWHPPGVAMTSLHHQLTTPNAIQTFVSIIRIIDEESSQTYGARPNMGIKPLLQAHTAPNYCRQTLGAPGHIQGFVPRWTLARLTSNTR